MTSAAPITPEEEARYARDRGAMQRWGRWVLLICGGYLFYTAVFSGPDPAAVRKQQLEEAKEEAVATCQVAVRARLKSPSSAEFGYSSDVEINEIEPGRVYKVRSYVDAQNSFGGQMRADWIGVARKPDEDDAQFSCSIQSWNERR